MVAMVTFISTLIHLYSRRLHVARRDHRRASSPICLFTFMMLMLVTADNLVQLFFGWEGVGLASYLLIGYWYEQDSANRAAMKAFIVNRVGDLFFMLGLALTFCTFGSDRVRHDLRRASPQHTERHASSAALPSLELIGVLLFLGACGKSAQLGLHTWLPDAMEGPTPVSALIHAATMVTAGVFLMARMSPLMEYAPVALAIVTIVGATHRAVRRDHRLRAERHQAGHRLLHLLAARLHVLRRRRRRLPGGDVPPVHPRLLQGAAVPRRRQRDPRHVGRAGHPQAWAASGRKIPVTYAVMWIGNLALAGMPFFAGYYSKDAILEAAFAAHSGVGIYAFVCGMLAAFLTAFYSWRLLILTFHGAPRADHHTMEHVHESPLVMLVPLILLAVGAVRDRLRLRAAASSASTSTRSGTARSSTARTTTSCTPCTRCRPGCRWRRRCVGVAGIALAYVLYMFAPGMPVRLASTLPRRLPVPAEQVVFRRAVRRDLRPAGAAPGARCFWKTGDARDHRRHAERRCRPRRRGVARGAVRIQTGRVANYAFAMIIGLVALRHPLPVGR